MWLVKNRTAYAAGRTWGRNKDGIHEWIVAVRGTFDIEPNGRLRLADEQDDPLLAAEYSGEDGSSSLRYDADLVPPKPTTDIILNATAYAPGGRPAKEFVVSMRVGSVQKSLRVVGDRTWEPDGAGMFPSTARPVSEVPIVYERAYGGWDRADADPKRQKMDPRNPVGVGVVAQARRRIGQALHNFEYPDCNPETVGPAGFGAIASHWSPRLALQGTYDEKWAQSRRPLLPEDWDARSLLCAPADQQPPAHLRGGERVELVNLTAHGSLKFELPKVYLTFTTMFSTVAGRRVEEHRSRLSSVIIEPDRQRVSMVWVSSLLCREDEDYLDQTVVREKPYI